MFCWVTRPIYFPHRHIARDSSNFDKTEYYDVSRGRYILTKNQQERELQWDSEFKAIRIKMIYRRRLVRNAELVYDDDLNKTRYMCTQNNM